MATDLSDYFLFVGAIDSESATTRLRATGTRYHKKLLQSGPENWTKIVELIQSPHCRGVLVVLRASDYQSMCLPQYEDAAPALLDAIADRPHVVLVHEAVFLTDEQRAAADAPTARTPEWVPVGPPNRNYVEHDPFVVMSAEDMFDEVSDDVRSRVNSMLSERRLTLSPYRTNAERSVIVGGFLEDNEQHLLFRLYVPSGRLYAQEAEALLGMFREWLTHAGHNKVRQEGYSTSAGQVFEFFKEDGKSEGDMSSYFGDFSQFLTDCMKNPEQAVAMLVASNLSEAAAVRIVPRYATRARRLTLDLKQSREERMLSIKHEFENLFLEVEGVPQKEVDALLDELLPPSTPAGLIEAPGTPNVRSATVNYYNSQFIQSATESVVQNIGGTVNFGPEAKQLLALVQAHGGDDRPQLETYVHELEDEGARNVQRVQARARLKGFLADLGNRGLGLGLNVLQKYVEHKAGLA